MKKRLIWILVAVLLCNLLPAGALAADDAGAKYYNIKDATDMQEDAASQNLAAAITAARGAGGSTKVLLVDGPGVTIGAAIDAYSTTPVIIIFNNCGDVVFPSSGDITLGLVITTGNTRLVFPHDAILKLGTRTLLGAGGTIVMSAGKLVFTSTNTTPITVGSDMGGLLTAVTALAGQQGIGTATSFEDNAVATIGDEKLLVNDSFFVAAGSTLTIGSGATLKQETGSRIVNRGTIKGDGTLHVEDGTFDNYGTVDISALTINTGARFANQPGATVNAATLTGGNNIVQIRSQSGFNAPSTVRVTFEPNNGSPSFYTQIVPGKLVSAPADPKKENKLFSGWYTDKDCTEAFDFDAPVFFTTTLYAGWDDIATNPPKTGDSTSFIWLLPLAAIAALLAFARKRKA